MALLDQFRNVFRIPELRRKILITVGLLLFCRVGVYVPIPGINIGVLGSYLEQISKNDLGRVVGMVNLFAGGLSTMLAAGFLLIWRLLASWAQRGARRR